jgi:O-antigen/teichoic acid export membrane protein
LSKEFTEQKNSGELGATSASSKANRFTFYRQGSWMVIATVGGGVFMSAVHVVANTMDKAEYGVFYALLRIFLLMGFPAGGLQTVFTQQSAAAVTEHEQRQLAATTRSVLAGTLLIWLAMAGAAFFWQDSLLAELKIINPAALWITVCLGFTALWHPILKGLLQGNERFLALGWILILDGIGRFTSVALIVHWGGQAAGGLTGALIGQAVSLGLGAWYTRTIWMRPGAHFDWKPWLRLVLPLTCGVGVILFMTSADVVFVQSVFPEQQTPFYMAASMIGLALVTFTTPLTSVMFPKIVQSAVRTEHTDALKQALGATAFLGGLAAIACTLFPALPLKIIYFRNPIYWQSSPLVPWFAWCLLPLIMANVLVVNLLARKRFAVVPWLMLVAIGYSITLAVLRKHLGTLEIFAAFKVVIQTLGVFSLLMLALAMIFTWRKAKA